MPILRVYYVFYDHFMIYEWRYLMLEIQSLENPDEILNTITWQNIWIIPSP